MAFSPEQFREHILQQSPITRNFLGNGLEEPSDIILQAEVQLGRRSISLDIESILGEFWHLNLLAPVLTERNARSFLNPNLAESQKRLLVQDLLFIGYEVGTENTDLFLDDIRRQILERSYLDTSALGSSENTALSFVLLGSVLRKKLRTI